MNYTYLIINKLICFFQKKTTSKFSFIILFFIGLFIFKDYGIPWDEKAQIDIAKHSYDYVFKHDIFFQCFKDKDYGVAFELPVYIFQNILFKSIREQYFFRHLMVHLVFLFSVLCFYKIIIKLFKSNAIAYLACAILVISPRIYADSFYNSKDLVFLSIYIIAFYTFILFFEKYTYKTLFLLALTSAIATNIRILGILLVFFTIINLLLDKFSNKINWKQWLKYSLIYLFSFSAILYITWPYLWNSPWRHLITVFENMKHFRWQGEVLFYGKMINATNLPWYYLFTWIGITTPELYLLFFSLGTYFLVYYLIKNINTIIKNTKERNLYIAFSIVLIPVLSVIIQKSVLYDGWRHMFFIYPFIIIIAIFGINQLYNFFKLAKKKYMINILFILLGLNFIYIGGQMIYYHPFQNCYFNNMISHDKNRIRHKFEMDYWGVSSKQGLEYLVNKNTNNNDTIKLRVHCSPAIDNLDILDVEDKNRIKIVDHDSIADYFITNYRLSNFDFTEYPEEVFKAEVCNSSIISIFRVK